MIRVLYSLVAIVIVAGVLSGCKTPSILVTEEQRLGDRYNNEYAYEQAIVHYKGSLQASLKLGVYRNMDMEADICRKISHAYSVLGKYDPAEEYILKALIRDSAQENSVEIIEDYRELGKIYLYRGEFGEGIDYLNLALDLNEGMESSIKGTNQRSVADTYLTLAQLYTVLGDFKQGELYGLSALRIFRSLNDKPGEMESLLQIGKIHAQTGANNSAESYLNQSMEVATGSGLSSYRHLEALARIQENRALYEEALRLKLDAIEEAKRIRILPQIIWSHMLTGDLYALISDEEKAQEYYHTAIAYLDSSQINAAGLRASSDLRAGNIDQAKNWFTSIGSRVASGIASMRLGELALGVHKWEDALTHFDNALNQFSLAGLDDGMARAHLMQGITYIEWGRPQEAGVHLYRADSLVRYDETRWKLYFAQGNRYEALEQPDSAIIAYERSIEVIEQIRGNFTVEEFKSLYLEDKMEVYNSLIQLLMESSREREALVYSEKARARTFLDMMGNIDIKVRHDEDQKLAELESKLRQQMQSLTQLLQKNDMGMTRGMTRSKIEQDIVVARDAYQEVVQTMKLKDPEYVSMVNMEPAELEQLQSAIDPESAFLVYWVGKEHLHIWMVTKDNLLSKSIPVTEDQIIDLVVMGRETIGSKRHIGFFTQLYNYLIKPFEIELQPFNTLGFIPHLPLHFLPYQCLMPDYETYLIDRYNLFYSPSLNVHGLSRQKMLSAEKELFAVALGGLNIGGFSGLPGTTREVSQISTLFSDPVTKYESGSTESFFKAEVSDYRYVHIATHGYLDPVQPMYSYLLMAPTEEDDGLLTVNEIFGLSLNSRLVVMSACETGLGALSGGDEIIGLSRAFLYAGANDVVVSLWSVADEPTAYLMTQFYSHLKDQSAVQSLRLAQLAVKLKYDNPTYWAPFQLIGAGY